MAIDRQKQRTLLRLTNFGADTEKKITALSVTDILSIPGVTVTEIHTITELQDAIKGHRVIRYLSGGTDVKPKEAIKEEDDHGQEDRDCGSEDFG